MESKPHWANLASSRYWFGSLIGAALAGVLPSLLWAPLFYVVGVPVLLLLLYVNLVEQVYYCPSCKKRVKVGADVCHHCGRSVKPAANESEPARIGQSG